MPVGDEEMSANSKSSNNPLKKLLHRKAKPTAEELLEKALAEKCSPVKQQQSPPKTKQPLVKAPRAPKKSVDQRLGEENKKRSFLCRTKFFKDMSASAFDLVDVDGSGTVDEKELYSGLLLIHLKLGTYAGPAACRPISRDQCHAVFLKMDVDNSGHLDREEFEAVMMVLFGNVMTRVAIQYAFTLLIVPMIAQLLLDRMTWLINYAYHIVATLDEHNEHFKTIERNLEHVWKTSIDFWAPSIDFWAPMVPGSVYQGVDYVQELLSAIPDSVWNTIPLTLLSTVLCLILVPWTLLKIDDVFQWLADQPNAVKAKAS